MNRSASIIFSFAALLALIPSAFPQAIVIDHNCTDLNQIPAYWIEQAKNLKLHYAHTSHGSQVVTGIETLEDVDSYYSVAVGYQSLPAEAGALCIFEGQETEDYITPGLYWDSEAGRQATRDVLNHNLSIQFSMWAWCGEVSAAPEAYINSYLAALTAFETEFSGKRFIYMTGHMDGTGRTDNLYLRNQQIRSYCSNNGKVLFDFNDIERYDPDGNDYLDLSVDDGGNYWLDAEQHNWAQEWCADHPGDDRCAYCGYDGCCAHSQPLNCNMKARAFWWMMARLAGWNGQTGVPTPTPVPSPTPLHARIDSGDYNGDGSADVAVFRPASGLWSVRNLTRTYFGASGDLPVSGDFDADGTSDFAVFRPASGLWSVRGLTRFYLGSSRDWAVPGDYGSGAVAAAVFRPAFGLWSVRNLTRIYFGNSAARPVPGDYLGDGTEAIAVFDPAASAWSIRSLTRVSFGLAGDDPAPADYDGDGSEEIAIYRPASGLWSVQGMTRTYFGGASDRPVPADYTGDGTPRIAVFRETVGLWSAAGLTRVYFGASGSLPATR